MVKKGAGPDDFWYSNRSDPGLVVYPGACVRATVDTGWVACEVRDGKGGGAYAGTVHIIVRQ
jgi:hypothetical protein